MRSVLTLLLLVQVQVGVGCDKTPPTQGGTEPPSGVVMGAPAALDAARIEVASNDADYAAERFGRVFRLSQLDDLVVRLHFAGAPPVGREVALEIYVPGTGLISVYRRLIAGQDAQIVVPVSGTDITKRQLVGQFALVATLDGVQLATTTVELQP